jgi:hypothetical protein
MDDLDQERRTRQRAVRDQHLREVESSLNKASDLIAESRREVRRSRGLLEDQRKRNALDDREEDERLKH